MKKSISIIMFLLFLSFLFAGSSHPVYIELVNDNGEHPDSATFQAWIIGRETQILP